LAGSHNAAMSLLCRNKGSAAGSRFAFASATWAVVEEWLAKKPDLRLATVADCLNKDGLAATRQKVCRRGLP